MWVPQAVHYYSYSALGPVRAETRAQSGDWYGSGTLHPGQILRGSLPLLSPRLDVPTFATTCPHVRHYARDPSGGRWKCGREYCPVILPKWRLPRHLGIFCMPQIYEMGPTALLPLRRKACWGFFFALKNPTSSAGFETTTLGTKGQHATPRPP
jgi:hypothetical protein